MKKLLVLGSTGRIGIQTLELVRQHPDKFELVGLSGYSNGALLTKQAREFQVNAVCCASPSLSSSTLDLPSAIQQFKGVKGLVQMVESVDADIVVVAIVGVAALVPTMAALNRGMDVAIASKEVLVAGGHLIEAALSRGKSKIFPVDSEHAALSMCMLGRDKKEIRKVILTASGGPFLHRKDLSRVGISDALNHPNWSMGKKITVDSATMINKGLEVIEAHWLFDMDYASIDVVIHPESIVHGMVELNNGAVLAQLGAPDMKLPIWYAINETKLAAYKPEPLDLFSKPLSFSPPDLEKFSGLMLAYEVGKQGHSWPTIFNAANEQAVDLFLQGRIKFLHIVQEIKHVLQSHKEVKNPTLEQVIDLDQWARLKVDEHVSKIH